MLVSKSLCRRCISGSKSRACSGEEYLKFSGKKHGRMKLMSLGSSQSFLSQAMHRNEEFSRNKTQ